MASITDRGNGTFLVRVYNGVKNGKPQSVAVTFKANAGSSPAVARRAAEKYAALFEELVHSGGYERKPQAIPSCVREDGYDWKISCSSIIILPLQNTYLRIPAVHTSRL